MVVTSPGAGRIRGMNKTIVLLTDFGLSDAYVGTMKGVMAGICSTARFIDITHDIMPQNVRQAAYVLLTAYRFFPPDTVFLVVVDPGVGTPRDPVAVATDYGIFVAPDNGVLSYVLTRQAVTQIVRLQNPAFQLPTISQTFHGRDIFSPAAAYIANGIELEQFGPALPELLKIEEPRLEITENQLVGEVLHIDHFGNVITSLGELIWHDECLQLTARFGPGYRVTPQFAAARCTITAGAQTLTGIQRTYGAVPVGMLTALVGSSGQLEIGVNQGNAALTLNLSPGDPIIVTFETD